MKKHYRVGVGLLGVLAFGFLCVSGEVEAKAKDKKKTVTETVTTYISTPHNIDPNVSLDQTEVDVLSSRGVSEVKKEVESEN